MGSRGPLNKRSDLVRRRNKDNVPDKAAAGEKVKAPAESREWNIAAKRWYRSLKRSGQSQYYEASDWAYAQLASDLLSMELDREKPRAVMISKILSMMDNLMTSEGARRRMRLELVREGSTGGTHGDAEIIPLNPETLYGG